ncbi:MAG: S1C family serine protease [Candidatus Limnocylindrales bacterium]
MTEPRPDDTLSYYSPPPEPRPTWSQEAWNAAATPSQWIEPYPARPPSKPEPARGTGAGLVVVAALLAAVLASGGTYAALDLSGNLNRPAPAAAVNAGAAGSGSPSQQVVTVNEQSAIVQAAQDVSPAVVTITTQQQASALDPFALPATGVGSGIIYNPNGWIVTNHHVVAGATNNQVQVQLKDGRTLTGSVYGLDTLTDLAIVKISGSNLPAAPIGDSGSLQPGQLAIAIGSPLGTFTNSVTSGIISALGRQIQVTDDQTGQPVTLHNLIQTDAAINPGNSGGALVNAAGQVIGINTATASTAQGIGFAIPINIARPIMAQAVAGQPLTRPWIGIHFTSLDPQTQQQLKTPLDYGAFIGPASATAGQPLVEPGSPAAQAGLKAGDIITALDGQRVDVAHPLDMLLVTHSPGQTVTLQVLRNGQQLTVRVTLGTRPASAAEQ